MVIWPRATFERLLANREGSILELLPWLVLVACTVSPIEAGRAVLLGRLDVAGGLFLFGQLLSARMATGLVGALIAALLLTAIERVRQPEARRIGFDRALDLAGFMLLPHWLLMSLGMLLSCFGAELWWMPHHRIFGQAAVVTLRVVVGFGWSLALFCGVARARWKL